MSIHHKSVLLIWPRVTYCMLHTAPQCGGCGFMYPEPFDPRKEDNNTSDVLFSFSFFSRATHWVPGEKNTLIIVTTVDITATVCPDRCMMKNKYECRSVTGLQGGSCTTQPAVYQADQGLRQIAGIFSKGSINMQKRKRKKRHLSECVKKTTQK